MIEKTFVKIKKTCVLICCFCSIASAGAEDYFNLQFHIGKYDYNYFDKLTGEKSEEWNNTDSVVNIQTETALWQVCVKQSKNVKAADCKDLDVCFTLKKGHEDGANVGVNFLFNNWHKENYVLLPGAAYNGNRFQSRRIAYSPKLLDPRDIGKDIQMIITDVPRLEIGNGPSAIRERSASMSMPSIGFYDNDSKKGFIVLSTQKNEWGDYGLNIEENRERTQAEIAVESPLVRQEYQYGTKPTFDKPADFKEGDQVKFKLACYTFPADRIQDLFDRYLAIRGEQDFNREYVGKYPYSHCFAVQEEKFNTQNYVPEWGYYAIGMRENYFQDWQIGWTGGMISTYPLLFSGSKITEERVIRNFDWLFNGGIAPCNLFWDAGEKGNIWYGGDIRKPHTKNWHLIRKSGDALFFIIKQFDLMKKKGIVVKPEWEEKTRKVAQAFTKMWKENKQFGQFVDNISGEIKVGGSTSGAIVPAAMALSSVYFKDASFMETAESSAEMLYQKYITKGITCGGPGDAMQNPDSESSYAMLESFVTLYELTGQKKWLTYAEEMAAQYASWVFAYDYQFPATSTFGKMNMHAYGSVIANTQNKHSAPGICTHSGAALFRLYRMTGKESYLELLRGTAFNLPQYLSHKDALISSLPQGWMNERVNTTDWEGENRMGEVFRGSTWAETSLLLTCIEVPGIYIDMMDERLVVFDNLTASLKKSSKNKFVVEIQNNTKYEAKTRLFVDKKEDRKSFLPMNYLLDSEVITIKPNETKRIVLRR